MILLRYSFPFYVFFLWVGMILTFLLLGCARFRVEELRSKSVISLPVIPPEDLNPKMLLHAMENERSFFNFPLRPPFVNSKLYIVDSNRRLLRIFSSSRRQEAPLLVIGNLSAPHNKENSLYQRVAMGIPGTIAVSPPKGKNIYLQSFIPMQKKKTEQLLLERRIPSQQSMISPNPSYILHIDEKGKLIGKIGMEGYHSSPFEMILRIFADREDRMYVLHKIKQKLHCSFYLKGKLEKRFSIPTIEELGPLPFAQLHQIELENILPVQSGKFVIGSVSVRSKTSFQLKERIIYRQTHPSRKPVILHRFNATADFLLWASLSKRFYTARAEGDGSRLWLKIFNQKGQYASNFLISFPDFHASWRETFLDLEGKIFTSRLHRRKFELYQWIQ